MRNETLQPNRNEGPQGLQSALPREKALRCPVTQNTKSISKRALNTSIT